MTVDPEKLRQTLAQLHEQLDAATTLDPEAAAQLRAAAEEIDAALARQGDVPTEYADDDEPTLADRLTDAEQQFATEHPTISTTLQRLVDMLAQMGI